MFYFLHKYRLKDKLIIQEKKILSLCCIITVRFLYELHLFYTSELNL